jgi:hypothetical protein
MKRFLVPLVLLALLGTLPASADPEPAAEALFEAGRSLMKKGVVGEACAKFRESYRLQSAFGTQLNLALCEESLGNIARSWQLFHSLLSSLPEEDPRLPLVRSKLLDLDRRVPRILLRAENGLPSDAKVEGAGLSITSEGFGVPIPVERGMHVFLVMAPGHAPRAYEIEIEDYQVRELTVGAGASDIALAAPAATKWTGPGPTRGVAARAQQRARPNARTLRTAGLLMVGAGAASLIASAALGYEAIQHAHAMNALCRPDGACTPAGSAAARSGKAIARAATLVFALGVTVGGGGSALVVLSGATRSSTAGRAAWPGGELAVRIRGAY